MARKEELRKRSDLLSRRVGGGHGGKPIILAALEQVEREVWKKAGEEVLYHAYATDFANYCDRQQKELG